MCNGSHSSVSTVFKLIDNEADYFSALIVP